MRIPFDIIGSKEKAVAIIGANQIPDEKEAAEYIFKKHKNVKTVLKKLAERKGIFRTYPCKLIAGDPDTEVIHKEGKLIYKLDPQKVYFSPREVTERERIAGMVKPNEKILVMFSGVAPFAIAIKKRQPDCEIDCVEINPDAVKYAKINLGLNAVWGINIIEGDVRKVKLGKYDRILMPLAETGYEFLDVAFAHAKKGAIIHLYGLSDVNFKEKIEKITKGYKILGISKAGAYAPRITKVRVDIEADNKA